MHSKHLNHEVRSGLFSLFFSLSLSLSLSLAIMLLMPKVAHILFGGSVVSPLLGVNDVRFFRENAAIETRGGVPLLPPGSVSTGETDVQGGRS